MGNQTLLVIEDEQALLQRYVDYGSQVFESVLSASTVGEAMDKIESNEINCILSDNLLPDGKGIELIKQFRDRLSSVSIIMITGFADKNLAIDSVNYGVTYFLEKPVTKTAVIDVLKKCYQIHSDHQRDNEFDAAGHLQPKTIELLTGEFHISDRELEVIQYALTYHKNAMIAEKLFISVGTVKRHIHNILSKMGVSSKEELQKKIIELNKK